MKNCCSLKLDRYIYQSLDSCLIDTVSIEIYEIRIFRSDFRPMMTCLCKFFFFTTLDIYKAYFKSHNIREYKENTCKKWPSALFSLKKILHFCALEFCNKVLLDLHCWWSEELCSQHLFSSWWVSHVLGVVYYLLVTHWNPCKKGDVHILKSSEVLKW